MGARGPKSKFTDAACPNEDCEMYGQAGRTNIAGNGTYLTNNGRIQKYVCRSCGTTFCDRTNTAFCDLGTKDEKVVRGLKMQLEGLGVRATARTPGVRQDTVALWNRKAAEHCRKVEEAVLKDAEVNKVEADGLWTVTEKKKLPEDGPEDGGTRLRTAFDPDHKAVIAHEVGERKQRWADKLIRKVRERVSGMPEFFSDGPALYPKALTKVFGRVVRFPMTGKWGRPRSPRIVPEEGLRYGQVIKHRRGGRLAEVERKQVFGKDAGPAGISTSGVERCNLTVRRENSRPARKALGFSKSREFLRAHTDLFFAHYNICRPHGSLVHADYLGRRRKFTPMRELGITDHNWGLEELLTCPYYKVPS